MGRESAKIVPAIVLLIAAGCSRQPEQSPGNTGSTTSPNSEAEIQLTAAQAKAGAEASVSLPERFRSVTVHIPPGVTDGARLRLKGQALPGPDGVPRDFVIRIRVK
jgi:hypothetical protein